MPVLIGRRSEDSGGSVPRVNVVAVAILLGSVVLGILGLVVTGNPIPLVAMILVGILLMQSPRADRAARHHWPDSARRSTARP